MLANINSFNKLVTIIVPVFNGEKFIYETVISVLNQSYNKWELILVDDGSEDLTAEIVKSFHDERIRYFYQDRKGVSAARNFAIKMMKGDFFCFLDSDDVMPRNSLASRLAVFKDNPDVSFVDGMVLYMNTDMTPTGKNYIPSFKGYPFDELLKLSRSCYFGNTWMIKREQNINYKFRDDMTHAEDLFFYFTICKNRQYTYTESPVLYYRQREDSAMKDLAGLEKGYIKLLINVKSELNLDTITLKVLKKRITRVMFLTHLKDGRDPCGAIKSLIRFQVQV